MLLKHKPSKMSKIIFIFLLLFFTGFAQAESSCGDIPGTQSHAKLNTNDGDVCFVKQRVASSLEVIAVYFIPRGHDPVLAEGGELVGDGVTVGKIDDAFLLDIDNDGKDEIIIIHSLEVQYSKNGSYRKHYFVYVFNLRDGKISLNESASEWFGSSQMSDNFSYSFPFTNRQLIQKSLISPYATFMISKEAISAVIRQKSYLYERAEISTKTKKYLIIGDKVSVDKYTADWCRVNYSGGKKPLQMWMMCDALEVDTGKQ
jgi:hypothetical protein